MAINILVTEDEIIVRKDIERCLAQLGYNIIATADNGKDAISLALKHKPDICLMDIKIKGDMSGIEAAQEIKSNLDVPVIFLTAFADEDTLSKAKIAEPHGYILKPFKDADIQTAIEMALHKHSKELELKQETDFLRGYAAGFGARPMRETNRNGFGDKLKSNLLETKENGMWSINAHMMGETIPKETNQVSIDKEKKDSWGIPQINIDVDYDANDEKMINDFFGQFTEMFTKAGFKNIKINDNHRRPGNDIHEMGGVRMGKDPKTSLLNKWNQLHQCKNVFVSDGACMTSTSTQNPSLTFMAISARAANYAINEIKKGNL